MKTVKVVAAVIKALNQEGEPIIFATQRGYGEFKDGWEFPGGKIEEGETPQEALKREIMEELDTEITVGKLIDTIEYDYPTFHVSMDCFWCEVVKGELVLKEAEDAKWLKKDELGEFIGENGHFSSMFDFSAQCLSFGGHGWYDAPDFTFKQYRNAIFNAQKESENVGFLSNIIENHDEPRGASRYLPEHARNAQGTKMLGTIIVLLRGIPFIYQGQEIGMTNTRFEDISEYDDINTINEYNLAIEAGKTKEEAMDICYKHSRDNGRTPMQWSDEKNAGFTTGTPWLKVNPLYAQCNVREQEKDNNSVLNYYKKLIALRKNEKYADLFVYGKTTPIFMDKDNVFAYKRVFEGKEILVVANFGQEDITLEMEKEYQVLLNNMEECEMANNKLVIKSTQALVLK